MATKEVTKDENVGIFDFTKDDWLEHEQNEPIESREFWEFGKFSIRNKVFRFDPYQAGEIFTVDEITLSSGEPFTRKGMRNNDKGKGKGYFLLQEKSTKDGEKYTVPHFFTSSRDITVTQEDIDKLEHPVNLTEAEQAYLDKNGKISLSKWSNFQAPALQASMATQAWVRPLMTAEKPVYAKALKATTPRPPYESTTKFNDDGTPKVYYDNYFSKFVFFKTKEEFEAAERAYFDNLAASNSSGSGSTVASHYPATWGEHSAQMLEYMKKLAAEGKSHKEIAEQAQLFGAKTGSGADVNVADVLAEALGIPSQLIEL